MVSWLDASHQTQYLSQSSKDQSRQLTFSVDHDTETTTALFEIRLPIELKASPNAKTPLFLYIHPEQVTSLTHYCLNPDDTPQQVREKLGDGVVCLKFQLSSCPDMIVPKSPLVPKKQKDHGEKLDALKQLAQQTALDVYVGCSILPDAQARMLCDMVLDPKVRTSCDNHLSRLYGSKGATLWLCSENLPTAPPPSYNQTGSAPPLFDKKEAATVGIEAVSNKRRRNSGGEPRRFESALLETVEMRLAEHMNTFRHELQQAKEEILAHIDKRFDDLDIYNQGEVDDKFYEMDKEVFEAMSTKVDEDNLDSVKLELQVYVKEEMREMKGKVVKRLKASSWNLSMDSGSDSNSDGIPTS